VSFDLTMPTLSPVLVEAAGIDERARHALARALDRKDAASVRRLGGAQADTLTELLLAAGPADPALAALAEAKLPAAARPIAERLADTVAAIRERAPGLRLTLDPVEFRGFRYHTGVCVTVYAPGRTQELGRGGRYLCGDTEPATGLTLYPDVVLRVAQPAARRPRVFVPAGADHGAAKGLRARGWATVAAVDPVPDPEAEARRLGCAYILRGADAVALD